MSFIYLQTSKIQVFDIQIMKNFKVSFWQILFCFDFEAEITATHDAEVALEVSQWDCSKFFLANILAICRFWLVRRHAECCELTTNIVKS